MHNSNRRSGRGAKTGTGRAGRGSGKNSVPQNASPPIASPKSLQGLQGLYANPPFVYVASVARGCIAELQVRSGKKFEGILTTISPSGEIELRAVHAIDPNDSKAIPSHEQVTDKMLFKASSIVCIEIKDVDLDYANRGADAFQTDAEIAARRQNGQATERELEVWQGDSDSKDGGLGSESENGWSAEDMFRKNEQLGVTSSYDSNLGDYTTPLKKDDTEEFQRKVDKANRLAREIESSSDFRNRANLEASEEEQFSAVVRPHGPPRPGHSSSPSPVSASSNAESLNTGRYVPPALRGKQQGDGLSGGGPPGHHRNPQRGGATPPGLSMQSAGRARAQSPHMQQMHPSQHPQQPHPAGQTSPHGLPLPQQRVTTPPHGHPASRGAQMQIPSPQQVAAQHAAMTQRTPPGLPQPQAPLPQRIPVTGRRTAADVVQGSYRSPVQSAVPATAAIVDKHSNVVRDDKLREGAGLPDVDKKTGDVSQPQRTGPPSSDRSPRPGLTDPAKNATYAQLRDFKDNFRLPDKEKSGSAPTVSTSATPQQPLGAPTAAQPAPAPTQQTQQQTQQKPPQSLQQQQQPQQPQQQQQQPAVAAANQPPSQLTLQSQSAVTPTTENKEPAKAGSPSSPPHVAPATATASNPASPAAPTATTVAATAATASTTKPVEKPATSSPSEQKKEDTIEMIVKKSNLNPNAKEFNPQAKPFVSRIQPQKTPTPPRPPSQPSPVIPSPGQYTQPINQSIYPAMTLHPQQNLHYPSMKYINQRKGATNLPQPRGHQPDMHPILPVSMATGQPLVTQMPAHMSMLPFATPQPGGGAPVSSAQPINHQVISHQVMQQQPLPYHVYSQKQMTPRLANQQSMAAAAAGQPGSHGQHQLSQDNPVMVFPQMLANINSFQPAGNIPISQQNPNQGVHPPFHQFTQPQPQPQPHQNPTAHLQHQPHQHQQHQHQPHPHGHQHTTPPQAHTPQGQNQANVMQQPQPHGGRPSPSPVNQVMHQASPQVLQQSRSQQQQQQSQQQQQQQQQQAFHPQGMQAMHQQPQNAQMMAAVAAVNQQNAAGTAPHSTGNHNHQQQQQQQQQNMMQHIHQHPHIIHYQPATNITNVTPVHSTPHPHPKTVFLHSTQGQQGTAGQPQGVQAIHVHSQPPIMSSPVQGHYMPTQGQLQPQVQQYQPNN